MTWVNPVPDLTSDEEEELIDALAKKTVEFGLEVPMMTFLEGMTPMSRFAAEIPLLMASPFLEALGINSYEYVALFSKREVIDIIIQRIEDLHREKDIKKRKENPSDNGGLINKIKKFFTGN